MPGETLIEFDSPDAWRAWLDAHHDSESEAWLVIQKKASTAPGVRYVEAVLEALCYGWIDGKMRRIDDLTFMQRFTPRRPGSVWSHINVERVEHLISEGRMTPVGMELVAEAKRRGSWEEAYGKKVPFTVGAELSESLDAADAQDAFDALPMGSRREYARWVGKGKRPETRTRRAAEVAARALAGKRIGEP